MKAISLWQPWASLWLSEHKVHETRHWPCRYHGWLLVHAAKKFPTLEPDDPLCDMLHRSYGADWRKTLPTGAIIGAVNLISTMSMEHTSPEHDDDRECGNWSPERFAWRRGDYARLAKPIPYKGQQGIFNVPTDREGLDTMGLRFEAPPWLKQPTASEKPSSSTRWATRAGPRAKRKGRPVGAAPS